MKVKDLKPAGYNPRKITDKKLDMLGKSMKEYGDLSGIIFNRQTGNLIGGHQRIKHLNPDWEVVKDKQGEGYIVTLFGNWAYREVDWSLKKEMAANVAANKHGGEFDYIKLKDLIVEIDDGSIDMELTGFDEQELQEIFGFEGKQGLTDDDAIPDKVEPISKTGDLWLLGEHRVLCGDATKREDVDRLMKGKKADMVFTDPPYGVSVNQGDIKDLKARNRRTDGKVIIGDNLTGENLRKFMEIVFFNYFIILKDGGVLYVCHAEGLGMDILFRETFAKAGFKPAEIIVWVKDQFAFGRQDYHWRHEPIIYGWKEGAAHYFIDDHTQDTVWQIDRPKQSESHPTMKPVDLCEKAIRNSSKTGWIVVDLFGGSGSTLIACEKLGRKCRMMEIDEHYCDVIVKRWENFTGGKAILERS